MRRGGVVAALTLLLAREARAEPMPALDTARLLSPGQVRLGLLTPSAVGLTEQLELSTMAVPWLLLSPNGVLRVELARPSRHTHITGEYGVAIPTGAMRLTQGYLFASNEVSGKKPGWFVTPSVGLRATTGERTTLTGLVEATVGVPLTEPNAEPLEAWTPVDLVFAPALNRFRQRVTVLIDHPLLDWMRLRGGLHGYYVGHSPAPPRSPLVAAADVSLWVGLGRRVALSVGGIWYNADQRATEVVKIDGRWQRRGVRSNDVYPFFDVVVGPF